MNRLLLALILAAAPAGAQVLRADPPADEEVVDPTAETGFEAWLSSYRATAQAQGIRPETLDAVLSGLSFSPRVVALDRAQPDDSGLASAARFSDYLARRLEPVREARGLATKTRYQAKLAQLEAETGVPQSIVLGIWGWSRAMVRSPAGSTSSAASPASPMTGGGGPCSPRN